MCPESDSLTQYCEATWFVSWAPKIVPPCRRREANHLVEEFMLLANMAAAKAVATAFPDRSLLRRHPPPLERGLIAAATFAKGLVREVTNI